MKKFAHLLMERGTDQSRHVLWLTLNNPEASNAISLDMVDSLTEALVQADADPDVRVIVLTGAGGNFCAGGDLKAMQERSGMFAGGPNELRLRYIHGIQRIPKTIEALRTPLIAMVNGPAIGAGCDLAAMCDMRIGSEKARFGETFSKLGLVPGDGGPYFLARLIGHGRAMEMFLTGEIYSATEALNMGLLNRIVEHGRLREACTELALKIACNAPAAVSMTKQALKAAQRMDLAGHLEMMAAFQGIAQTMHDHAEGVAALLAKRPPEFQNR